MGRVQEEGETKFFETEVPLDVMSPEIFDRAAIMATARLRKLGIDWDNDNIKSLSWLFKTEKLGSVYEIAISGSPQRPFIGRPGLAIDFTPVGEFGIELPEYDIEIDRLSFLTHDNGMGQRGVLWTEGFPETLEDQIKIARQEKTILQFLEEADTKPYNSHVYIRAEMPEWYPTTEGLEN
jgi:hypothetical protein